MFITREKNPHGYLQTCPGRNSRNEILSMEKQTIIMVNDKNEKIKYCPDVPLKLDEATRKVVTSQAPEKAAKKL